MIYKVSYVVAGCPHSGATLEQETPPEIGDCIELGGAGLRVMEVIQLLPPQGDVSYLHVTCEPIDEAA